MRRWGFKRELYWCPNCNIPLRSEICSRCGGRAIRVKVNEPGDVRPAFEGDMKFIQEAMQYEFGSDRLVRKLGIKPLKTYLNRTPHYDDMKEVIVGGVVVGRLYFDPHVLKWRWRLNKLSAVKALEEGLIKSFIRDRVKPLETIAPANSVKEGDQALILDSRGDAKALAIVKRGKYRVQIIFKDKRIKEPLKRNVTFDDVYKGNEEYLRILISRSITHLTNIIEKVNLPILLSYSGGKDSLLSLDLTLKAGFRPALLFNDTGLEFPETVENVRKVSAMYDLRVIEAKAGDMFWRAVRIFGPPAKDYRWCCKVVKLAPIARIYRSYYPNGLLVIVGQRALESIDRSWSGRVWRNRWLPIALNTTPIHEWDQLSEWIYILRNRLPVNTLYFRGFDRLGCFLCPAAYVAEYYIVSREYPELWMKWIEILEEWRKKLGVGDYWLKYHLWRWLNPLGQGRRRVELWLGVRKPSDWISEYRRRSGYTVKGSLKDGKYIIWIKEGIDLNGIIKQYRALGNRLEVKREQLIVSGVEGKVKVGKNVIEAEGKNPFELAVTTLKLAVRWVKCANCRNCVTWCPKNSIILKNGKPHIISEKCIGCGICIEVCPISEVFVEKLLVSQLLGNPKGRPRKLRALSIEYAKAIRATKMKSRNKTEVIYDYNGIREFFETPT